EITTPPRAMPTHSAKIAMLLHPLACGLCRLMGMSPARYIAMACGELILNGGLMLSGAQSTDGALSTGDALSTDGELSNIISWLLCGLVCIVHAMAHAFINAIGLRLSL
ncbi:MAG: hypothetical protein ACRC22_14940, partial [Shewanella sp.]